jgi:hypothetical protein
MTSWGFFIFTGMALPRISRMGCQIGDLVGGIG